MHGSTGGGWKRNASALPRQLPTQPRSIGAQMTSKTKWFEKLLEAVPDALVGMDQKGVIRFVNRQTELLFGYDRDLLIGQAVEMLMPGSFRQIHAKHRASYVTDPAT